MPGTEIILSVLLGVGLGWLLAGARSAAASARADELRGQIASTERELTILRVRLSEAERARAAAETRADAAAQQIQSERDLLDDARARLTDAFKALAAEALRGTSQSFLQLADEKFKALRIDAATDLDARRQAIQGLVAPLQQSLDAYQREARELEQRRQHELGSVGEQLRQVATSHAQLQSETSRLVTALRAPHVRGRWGEIALRRTAELAGMTAYCDFTEQETVATEAGRLRPDMIVRLPSERKVIVDSKVPLTAYLEALEATDELGRTQALARHAAQVRQHVQRLASRNYASEIGTGAEFVVLFIPNDSFLAAAAEQDTELLDWALGQHVVLATPATFVALLRAVAYGWRQARVAEDARRISEAGRELGERMAVLADHLSRIGGSIGKAVEAYNQAVGSLESRVLPSVRKLEQLGAGSRRPVDELQPIDQAVRQLTLERLELEQEE